MDIAKRFEELWIWRQARLVISYVYTDFGVNTIGEKDYTFRNQIQSAAISVMNNIAEGFERNTSIEFARYLDIARGSCGEVRSMYYVAADLGYLSKEIATRRQIDLKQISCGINKLSKHLRNK